MYKAEILNKATGETFIVAAPTKISAGVMALIGIHSRSWKDEDIGVEILEEEGE